jgi:hypothetical protein
MSYAAWSVIAGEQPTTSKWNILGTNDSSFNDGSGLNNISNPIQAASSSHLTLTPGTSKFVKIAALRQDNTSNTYKNVTVILTGWGVMTGNTTQVATEGVTFGITFDQRPIVLLTPGGDETVLSSTYGNGGNSVQGLCAGKAHTITTTGFQAYIGANAGWSTGNGQYYQWIAIGELT